MTVNNSKRPLLGANKRYTKRFYPYPYPIHKGPPKALPSARESGEKGDGEAVFWALVITFASVLIITYLYLTFMPRHRVMFDNGHLTYEEQLESLDPNTILVKP